MTKRPGMRCIKAVLCAVLLLCCLTACVAEEAPAYRSVGLVYDVSTLGSVRYNQMAWDGITRAARAYSVQACNATPAEPSETAYLAAVKKLVEDGCSMIILPGPSFQTVAYQAQELYPSVQFVLLEGYPHNGDYNMVLGKNTTSMLFAESEAAFLAGYAAALQLQRGWFTVLGDSTDGAQAYYNAFCAGVQYAAKDRRCYVWVHPLQDTAGKGEPAIRALAREAFAEEDVVYACGTALEAVLSEARTISAEGGEARVVVTGIDRFDEGVYNEEGASCVMLSAIGAVDIAVCNLIAASFADTFPGGIIQTYRIADYGIKLAATSQLDAQVIRQTSTMMWRVRCGWIDMRRPGYE